MPQNIRMNEQPSARRFLILRLKKKKQARVSLPIDPVLLVSVWVLFNAAVFAITFGVDHMLTIYTTPSEPPSCSWLVGPDDPTTDAEEEDDDMSAAYYIWCSALQVAAAALELLLADHRRRIRRALAYAALTVAVASHCMFASDVRRVLLADDDPGRLPTIGGYAGIFVFAAGDLLGFLALLR